MKKFASILVLLGCLSITILADGDGTTHSGGKTCPNGQPTCFVETVDQSAPESTSFEKIIVFLKTFFG